MYKFKEGEEGRALNRLAREEMKHRLMADILADIQVCQLEGMDYREYLQELKELINEFVEKFK